MGDDTAQKGDDKGRVTELSSPTSSPDTPDTYAVGDDNGPGGRYFGATLGYSTSDPKKEIEDTNTQGESNPDLSSPNPGSLVAVDTETTGLNPHEGLGMYPPVQG